MIWVVRTLTTPWIAVILYFNFRRLLLESAKFLILIVIVVFGAAVGFDNSTLTTAKRSHPISFIILMRAKHSFHNRYTILGHRKFVDEIQNLDFGNLRGALHTE